MKQLLFILATLPIVFLASCSHDDLGGEPLPGTGGNENGGDIRFEIGFAPQATPQSIAQDGTPQTRVATLSDFTSQWEDGDEIGLFACTAGTALAASNNHIHNVKLTYSSTGGGTWTPSQALWWPSNGDKFDFYAYYPYDAANSDPANIAFNVKSDQSGTTSGKSNHSLSDLLTAKAAQSGGYGKGETVPLSFRHALAMVQVSIPKEYKGMGPSKGLTVLLRNVKPAAALNLGAVDNTTPGSEISLAPSGNDPQSITMYRLEQPADPDYETTYTYCALVPAQDIAQGAILFFFYHEGRQLLTDGALSAAVSMTAGQAEKFSRTLPATLIETAFIPKGTFIMGSPDGSNGTTKEPNRQNYETQHSVTLTKDFRMSTYPVTFAQYDAFCEATSRTKPSDEGWGRGDRPVINVTWLDAVAYCTWLSSQTDQKWTLPTEAQWEYACRGSYDNKATETATKPFGIGDGTKLVSGMANYYIQYSYDLANSGHYDLGNNTGYLGKTSPVGSYQPNNYGLYDMHGNVQEWCLDQNKFPPADYGSGAVTDPTGPAIGPNRVVRGGSCYNEARYCRSAYRYNFLPDFAHDSFGFRVVVVP